MSDRLTLANAIEDAGIERSKAERVASAIVDVIHDNVATKADLAATKNDLQVEIRAVRTDLQTEIRTVRTDLQIEIRAVRTEMVQLGHALTMRGLAGLIAGGGILFAALHYWPPHG